MRHRFVRAVGLLACAILASCSSTNGPNVTHLLVSPDTVRLVRFDSVQLSVSPLDESERLITGVAVSFAWNDTTIVRVSNLGRVQSVGPLGSTTVAVTGGGATTLVEATVYNFPAGIVVSPQDTAIRQRRAVQLTATVVDNTGTPVPGQSVSFVTGNASIASVSPTGLVTSAGPVGSATIIATSGTFRAFANVRVIDSSIAASLELSARPFGAAVSPQGVAYVTRLDAAALARVDLPTHAFSASAAVGSTPTGVTFNASGTTAYVTNQYSDNVGVVSVASNTQASTIAVLGDPSITRVNPDGKLLWVSTNVDTLYAFDLATGSVAHRFGFPWVTNGLAFHPTNDSLLYASVLDGAVREVNYKRDTVVRTFTLGGMTQGIAVAPNGSELYVANQGTGQLQFVSLSSGAVTASVPLGGAPFDLQLSPDGTKIWISVTTTGEVKVFDRVSRTLLRTITTSGAPRRIGFDPQRGTAVVANEAGWVDIMQ